MKKSERAGGMHHTTAERQRQIRPSRTPAARGWTVTITPRSIWLAAGVAALIIAAIFVLLKAFDVVILFFIAVIFAEGIRPVVDWLQRRRLPRPLGVLLTYVGITVVTAGLAYLLVQPVITQLTRLGNQLPHYMAQIQGFLNRVQRVIGDNPQIGQALNQAGGIVQGLASFLLHIPLIIGTFVFSIFIVATIAFFWLTGVEHLKPFVVSLFPEHLQPEASDMLSEMGRKIGGYLRGVMFNSLVIGVLSGTANFLLHVPYPVLLGILAGLTELIPYFGPWVSGGVAGLVALIAVGPLAAVAVIGAYIIIQQVEGNVLVPLVMMRAVDLNPLTVVIAVLLGTELLGIIGGILAVPAAVVVQVLVVRALAPVARHTWATQTPAGQAAPPAHSHDTPDKHDMS